MSTPPPPPAGDVSSLASVVGPLDDAPSCMSAEHARLTRILLGAGQAHLFAKWTAGHADKKAAFFAQVRIDWGSQTRAMSLVAASDSTA